MKKSFFALFALLPFALLHFGCALTTPLDKSIPEALARAAARRELDTLSYRLGLNAATGARQGFLTDSTNLALAAMLDLLDEKLQRTSKGLMTTIADTVQYRTLVKAIGAELGRQLNDEVLGQRTEARLLALRDKLLTQWVFFMEKELKQNLLGPGTQGRLAALRNELLGDSTRALIRELRGELTNEETARGLATLVNAALEPAIRKLDRTVGQNLKVTQKYANEIILALLAAALIVVAWVWYQRRKYLNLVKLLTVQINAIPVQTHYDELTQRIRREAINTSLEPSLQEVLRSQGL